MAERKKILIVEDESLSAMALEMYIEDAGFASAGIAASGEDAIELARRERPALIFMDLRLIGAMTGLDAARRIDAELRIPVVILSGYAERVVLEQADGVRPLAILAKPVDFAEVDEVLKLISKD